MTGEKFSHTLAIDLTCLEELPRPLTPARTTRLQSQRDQVLRINHSNVHTFVLQVLRAGNRVLN